ncbi:KIR protein [Plasmodium coatneyi]|uniref:KIR protein n=1 Tax=Plasmodium coatneyi TaxID=208452 RepID=A0A1B1DTQ9_9APIC|nr:KIR protein [Plasmodium coatneyi]ANQ06186.1 KIR protein [Plasmodium coatneyi]
MTKVDLCSEDDLPSRRIYAAFEQKYGDKQTCEHNSSWTEQMRTILEGNLRGIFKDEGEYAKEITQAWCHVSKMNTTSQSPCSVICDFFYFWLGNMLYDKWKGTASFKAIMENMYTKLQGFNNQCSYETIDNTDDTTLFKERKTIFDYYYDYRTIWKGINASKGSCTQVYNSYLEAADSAYRQLEASADSDNDDFCTKIVNKIGDGKNKIPPPSQLQSKALSDGGKELPPGGEDGDGGGKDLLSCFTPKSKPNPNPNQAGSSGSFSDADNGSASSAMAPAAFSSGALAAVALPTMLFFLYKVILHNYNI